MRASAPRHGARAGAWSLPSKSLLAKRLGGPEPQPRVTQQTHWPTQPSNSARRPLPVAAHTQCAAAASKAKAAAPSMSGQGASADDFTEAAYGFLDTIKTTLLALWAWVCKRVAVLVKTFGFKFTKGAEFYASFLLPGPWVLIWSWTQPEFNVVKKKLVRLPLMLGGDVLPSFISNPMELGLVLLSAIVGVFALVELVGVFASSLASLLCASSSKGAAPVVPAGQKEAAASTPAAAVAKEEAAAAPAAAAPATGYSLQGLLYLCLLQAASLLVLFCTDTPVKDFSAKYAILPGVNVRCRAPVPFSFTTRCLAHSLSPPRAPTPHSAVPPNHSERRRAPGPSASVPGVLPEVHLVWRGLPQGHARRAHVWPASCGRPLSPGRGQHLCLHKEL